MSDFTVYNSLLENKIANTSEVFYTNEMKRQEANNTIEEILLEYDPPEFIRKPSTTGTITFATGKVAKPSDYMRMVKLWDTDDNEYHYIAPDDFDYLDDTASYYWTEDYDPADDTRKLFIKPTSATALNIRYIKQPTEMNDDSTDCGLSSHWDEAVAYGTAMRLLQNSNRYDEAREMERLYTEKKAEAYMAVKNPGGIKQGNKLKSAYKRKTLLNR